MLLQAEAMQPNISYRHLSMLLNLQNIEKWANLRTNAQMLTTPTSRNL